MERWASIGMKESESKSRNGERWECGIRELDGRAPMSGMPVAMSYYGAVSGGQRATGCIASRSGGSREEGSMR